jgi:hypothetical protein
MKSTFVGARVHTSVVLRTWTTTALEPSATFYR